MTRKGLIAGYVLLALASGVSDARAQTAEDFGYRKMKALGARPLLVILTDFNGSPALRTDGEATAREFFDHLVFNPLGSPADPSLASYFQEISNGRFSWVRAGAGVVGPYRFAPEDYGNDGSGLTRLTLALQAAADDGFDFAAFDRDGNGFVTPDELGVIVVDNYAADGMSLSSSGANRASDPEAFTPDGSIFLLLKGAMVGHYASFLTMAHELLHTLGTYDLYGASQDLSTGYTTMGSTLGSGSALWHLDPFHKMKLGWVEPRLRSMQSPGADTVGAAQLAADDEPILLYNPLDLHEYFLLEYRTNAGYDADVPSSGLVIWQVLVDKDFAPRDVPAQTDPAAHDVAVFTLGAPDLARGHGTAWAPAARTLFGEDAYVIADSLRWIGGVDSGVQLKVGATVDGETRLPVAWGRFPAPADPAPRRRIVSYSDRRLVADVDDVDVQGRATLLDAFSVGTGYSNIVDDPAGLFYYSRASGQALLAQVDAAGHHQVVTEFPQGTFLPGWTHVVSHRGYLFFYNASNGSAAIGKVWAGGFRQLNSYRAGSFGSGWTHIVSTKNGLVYYRAGDGTGAVGDWEYDYTPCSGAVCVPTVSRVRHRTLSFFGAGSFATGWSSIVETNDGVLFYRMADGLTVMVDVLPAGVVSTRDNSFLYLRPGYTAAVNVGAAVFFYDSATGDDALAQVVEPGPWAIPGSVGSLAVLGEWSGVFTSGFPQVVTTAVP